MSSYDQPRLEAHGHPEAALRLLDRAIEVYAAMPEELATQNAPRKWKAIAAAMEDADRFGELSSRALNEGFALQLGSQQFARGVIRCQSWAQLLLPGHRREAWVPRRSPSTRTQLPSDLGHRSRRARSGSGVRLRSVPSSPLLTGIAPDLGPARPRAWPNVASLDRRRNRDVPWPCGPSGCLNFPSVTVVGKK